MAEKMAANKDTRINIIDALPRKEIYKQGYEMRKKVLGDEYVERILKALGSDFIRPLKQFATVCLVCLLFEEKFLNFISEWAVVLDCLFYSRIMIVVNGISEGAQFEGRLEGWHLIGGSRCVLLLGHVEQY